MRPPMVGIDGEILPWGNVQEDEGEKTFTDDEIGARLDIIKKGQMDATIRLAEMIFSGLSFLQRDSKGLWLARLLEARELINMLEGGITHERKPDSRKRIEAGGNGDNGGNGAGQRS